VFGFSFSGDSIRPPFDSAIAFMKESSCQVISIDLPSGWKVDEESQTSSFVPDMVISLTAPKICMRGFKGRHYLAGRFVPDSIATKYQLRSILSMYKGSSEYVPL
jgi:NAD(P)H-hydrate epimerase